MSKGYWIVRVDVSDPEAYKAYVAANATAFAKYQATSSCAAAVTRCARALRAPATWSSSSRATSRRVACFDSPEYQHAVSLRRDVATADLIIIEGYDGPQPHEAGVGGRPLDPLWRGRSEVRCLLARLAGDGPDDPFELPLHLMLLARLRARVRGSAPTDPAEFARPCSAQASSMARSRSKRLARPHQPAWTAASAPALRDDDRGVWPLGLFRRFVLDRGALTRQATEFLFRRGLSWPSTRRALPPALAQRAAGRTVLSKRL